MAVKKTFEFVGKSSGDCECFAFGVDEENYIKLKGKKPIKSSLPTQYSECLKSIDGKSYEELLDLLETTKDEFNDGLFLIYPDFFFGFGDSKKKLRIRIDVEEID